MNYRVLCDENVDESTVAALVDRGADAVHATERPGTSSPDRAVARIAREENRILVTNDEDFLNRATYPGVTVAFFPDNSVTGHEIARRLARLAERVPDQTDLPDVTYITERNVDF